MLGSKEAPKVWEIRTLFPDKSDSQIAEIMAEYFNRILNEFEAIAAADSSQYEKKEPPQMYQIAARLRSFKKPGSRVLGDIPPTLVNKI